MNNKYFIKNIQMLNEKTYVSDMKSIFSEIAGCFYGGSQKCNEGEYGSEGS